MGGSGDKRGGGWRLYVLGCGLFRVLLAELLASFTLSRFPPKNCRQYFKDFRANIFHSIDFFKVLLQSELLGPEMQKKLGVTVFVSDIKRVENYPDFDKLAQVIQHSLQGFIDKNIEGESKEANKGS